MCKYDNSFTDLLCILEIVKWWKQVRGSLNYHLQWNMCSSEVHYTVPWRGWNLWNDLFIPLFFLSALHHSPAPSPPLSSCQWKSHLRMPVSHDASHTSTLSGGSGRLGGRPRWLRCLVPPVSSTLSHPAKLYPPCLDSFRPKVANNKTIKIMFCVKHLTHLFINILRFISQLQYLCHWHCS